MSAKRTHDGQQLDMDGAGPSSKRLRKFTDFNPHATTFPAIRDKKTYIDKSLFIKDVFEDDEALIITAPRRFGKTTTLNMLKHFLEIDCSKDTAGNSTGNPTEKAIEQTDNYKLFSEELFDGEPMKIMHEEHAEIVSSYFGKYPVAYLDFKCDEDIESYEQALDKCKQVLQSAYEVHNYLCDSKKLESYEQSRCRDWCAGGTGLEEEEVSTGLKDLCKYLYKHYDSKKVFVLVDEYDSIIMKALFTVTHKELEHAMRLSKPEGKKVLARELLQWKGEELKTIAQLSIGILSAALKGDEEVMKRVERAVIVGISHIAGISGFNNITPRSFLSKFAYVEHFGLAEDDVKCLLKRYEAGNTMLLEDIKSWYNGYIDITRTHHIYPIWSVMKCLDEQRLGAFYEETGTIDRLAEVFQIPSIRIKIQQLVQMATTAIIVKTKIFPKDLVHLQEQVIDSENQEMSPANTFLSFLLQQGYLTYDKEDVDKDFLDEEMSSKPLDPDYKLVNVKVPNHEIRELLVKRLKVYYSKICKFDQEKQASCKESFDQMLESVGKTGFPKAVAVLQSNLQNLLVSTLSADTCLKLNEAALHVSICSIFISSEYKYCTEFNVNSNSRLDLAVAKGDYGIILEFKHNSGQVTKTTANDALQQIKTRQYAKVFDKAIFAAEKPNRIILIGLSVNNNKELSIACEDPNGSKTCVPEIMPAPTVQRGKARRSRRNSK